MRSENGPLSAVEVKGIEKPGLHFDKDGLYLNVTQALTKSWVYRYMFKRRAREMGLGSVRSVSLKKARARVRACKDLIDQGIDPLDDRRAKRAETKRAAKRPTFREAMERFIKNHEAEWKHPRYATNYRLMMERDAYPAIGDMWADEVMSRDVLHFMEPIWHTKPTTAKLMLSRMEYVFDDLIAREERTAANPARWERHLEHSLPNPSKIRPVVPQPSLPHQRLFEFMTTLRRTDYLGTRPLEFMILTAMRPDEALSVRWQDIYETERLWVVPPQFMKGRREGGDPHRVPLSDRALEILREMQRSRNGVWVFPGRFSGEHLNQQLMRETLKTMGQRGFTPHGFRSSFSTWATDCNCYSIEVIEFALAHTVAVKAAELAGVNPQIRGRYQRADLLELRRPLMEDWAQFTLTGKYPATYRPPLLAAE